MRALLAAVILLITYLSMMTVHAQINGIVTQAETAVEAEQELSKDWKTCSEDSNCIVIGDECLYDTVNKDFQEKAEKHLKSMNREVDCEQEEERYPKAVCRDATCTLQY